MVDCGEGEKAIISLSIGSFQENWGRACKKDSKGLRAQDLEDRRAVGGKGVSRIVMLLFVLDE